jgi:hypothetical protein
LRALPHLWHLSPLVAAAALAAGCDSGKRSPDVGTGPQELCADKAVCTPDPFGFCLHTCTPDPAPRLVECAKAEEAYTFMSPALWTFEEGGMIEGEKLARGMYSYTDNSTIIKTFTIRDSQNPTVRVNKTWEPRTAILPRCSDQPNDDNHAIHIQGGPFLSWGGGVGIGMKNFPDVQGSVGTIEALADDLSGWEGISFWARRGPDSQAGFRVLVGDKYTDDDVAYVMYRNDPMMPRYCERVRECGCLNHRTCTAIDLMRPDGGTGPISNLDIPRDCRRPATEIGDVQTLKFCGTPEVINGTVSTTAGGASCNTCVETRCNERWPAFPDDCGVPGGGCEGMPAPIGTDRQFYGKPCSPYTLRNGIFGYWCFDPAQDERPAETTEQCGDHWTRVVGLSSEWQFYTVPFNSMAQQGWAKRSAALDLKSVSVIRFTWDGGWVDFWIDDVRLYRTKNR